ncbi:M1 family metallopeptidase [Glaciibacter sp. 2TAF33]|uniref:M1 family metallopeptidase n=1 Tax=Glaciibacter sp. 2TAF33 TaxID=3233015 RepID=UPI003F91B4E2
MDFSGARRAATLVALGALLIGSMVAPGAALAASPHQAASGFTPGAPGLGDPYFPLDGNGGYDVKHYLLDLRYDPATDVLSGTAVITARATQNLSAFNLDFDGLMVRSVRVNARTATWARDAAELTVTPPRGIRDNSLFITTVRYDGVPITINDQFGPSGFFHTDDGALVVGQPHVAETWFPNNNHPLDKASYTFVMTVPEGLEVVANGRLIRNFTHNGLTTWAWQQSEPMASYLATASVGQWNFNEYSNGGIRYLDALDPDLFHIPAADPGGPSLGDIATAAFARQPEIIGFLAGYFGDYPFKNAGGIVDDFEGLGFALENQSRPIYPAGAFEDPLEADAFLVHELAHQWYGDNVAIKGWKDIWLNEGFATYAEWLWSENQGLGTVQELFDSYAAIPADDSFWELTIGDPGVDAIFDDPTYYRGAMTLHALRQLIGDDDFFALLKGWASTNAGGNVSTEDFIAFAEQVSGRDLTAFFDEWLYTGVKPAGLEGMALKRAPEGSAVPPSVRVPERMARAATAF